MGQLGLVFVAMGLCLVCMSAFKWDSMMTSRKVQNDRALLGPELTRFSYLAGGVGLVCIGAMTSLGYLF